MGFYEFRMAFLFFPHTGDFVGLNLFPLHSEMFQVISCRRSYAWARYIPPPCKELAVFAGPLDTCRAGRRSK